MTPVVIQLINLFVALIISLSIHEFAHAWAAKVRGDDTAEQEGRLTIFPGPHIDPFGTILFPLMGMASMAFMGLALPLFGWAKPVPVNLNNLKNRKWDHVFVAAAGPISNLILCTLSILIALMIVDSGTDVDHGSVGGGLIAFLRAMIGINALLAFFNLLPIPPLDGATVFSSLLPGDAGERYERAIAPYGMIILVMLMLTGALKIVRIASDSYTEGVFHLFAGFFS